MVTTPQRKFGLCMPWLSILVCLLHLTPTRCRHAWSDGNYVHRKLQLTESPTSSPVTLTPSPSVPGLSQNPSTILPTTSSITLEPTAILPTGTNAPTLTPVTASPSVTPTTARPSSAPSFTPSTDRPTQIPSFAPSTASPSVSPTHAPSTQSPTLQPSPQPSTQSPSGSPSLAPTDSPSYSPSYLPSSVPTVSQRPTTSQPSQTPSQSPSISSQPSSNPTVSQQPSVDPFGVDIDIDFDQDGNREIEVICRPLVPSDASPVIDQIIRYEYILNVQNGTDMRILLADIEEDISDTLTQTFLDCRFELVRDFYVHGTNSAPEDRIASGCLLEEQVPGATCYTIEGQLSAFLFYLDSQGDERMRQRRRLQQTETQIADENVANAFSSALESVFASPDFGPNVLSATFTGITNQVPPPPSSPRNKTPAIVAGVFGGLVGAAIIGYLVVIYAKRQTEDNDNQYYQEAMDAVDEEIDEITTLPPDLQPKPATIVNEEEEEVDDIDVPIPKIPVIEEFEETESRAVEFIGTSDIPHTPTETERMLEETKRELGPSPQKPRIKRDYDVSDTVDL